MIADFRTSSRAWRKKDGAWIGVSGTRWHAAPFKKRRSCQKINKKKERRAKEPERQELHQFPATKEEQHWFPATEGEQHWFPAGEGEPHSSLELEGDDLLLPPPPPWEDYLQLPPPPPWDDYLQLSPPPQEGDYLQLSPPPHEEGPGHDAGIPQQPATPGDACSPSPGGRLLLNPWDLLWPMAEYTPLLSVFLCSRSHLPRLEESG
ncbi:UNVERIFIED_CONTAM: hypothetical protein FKN15_045956 [Acipenser sinensis]